MPLGRFRVPEPYDADGPPRSRRLRTKRVAQRSPGGRRATSRRPGSGAAASRARPSRAASRSAGRPSPSPRRTRAGSHAARQGRARSRPPRRSSPECDSRAGGSGDGRAARPYGPSASSIAASASNSFQNDASPFGARWASARQGRREPRYAGISGRVRTKPRAAQRGPAAQGFILKRVLRLLPAGRARGYRAPAAGTPGKRKATRFQRSLWQESVRLNVTQTRRPR